MEVKKGWFVEWIHDLRAGLHFRGPFVTEDDAIIAELTVNDAYKARRYNWDKSNVLECEYVMYKGNVHLLTEGTMTVTSEVSGQR